MLDVEEYLISYANLQAGLFTHQNNFLDEHSLEKFYSNPFMGVPLCLPLGIKFFDYSEANFFKIKKIRFSTKIFKTSKLNYIGNKKYFRFGNIFASNVRLKKRYYDKFEFYISSIKKLKRKILELKNKNKKICSMQIRNAPHFGHEAVFKHILNKFDYLVLNPILGIKKKNDISDLILLKSLKYMEKKYKKLYFLPVWSNFHYAGPREAMHHLSLRQNLGFDYFYIGRDHAGAQNIYQPHAAVKMSIKYKNKFIINCFDCKGGYYCKRCSDYVIMNKCKHKSLINISGTEFRQFLKKKIVYPHADEILQKIIFKYI